MNRGVWHTCRLFGGKSPCKFAEEYGRRMRTPSRKLPPRPKCTWRKYICSRTYGRAPGALLENDFRLAVSCGFMICDLTFSPLSHFSFFFVCILLRLQHSFCSSVGTCGCGYLNGVLEVVRDSLFIFYRPVRSGAHSLAGRPSDGFV